MQHGRFLLGFLLPTFLFACSGRVVSGTGAPEPYPYPEPGPAITSQSIICDGSSATRFVMRHQSGGGLEMPFPGMAMYAQNGSALLTIDGQCNYLAYVDIHDVRTGTMTNDEAVQLERDLSVAQWRDAPRVWDGVGCDEAAIDYRFDDVVIAQTLGCGSPRMASSLDAAQILQTGKEWMQRLVAQSAHFDGIVRAIVYVPGATALAEVTATPKAWPIAVEPSTIALTSDQAIQGVGTVLSLSDSRLLRTVLAGGNEVGAPVVDANGRVYLVLTRDLLPGEAADGTIDLGLGKQ